MKSQNIEQRKALTRKVNNYFDTARLSKNDLKQHESGGTAAAASCMKRLTITARDGYRLSALLFEPDPHPMGTIILSGATGVKKEFYISFAKFLSDNGYSVLLYDYRGIGDSAPLDTKNSSIWMHEWGTQDMNAVLDYMVIKMGCSGIIWLGHSIGAQLIGFLEHRHHIRKVIAINAAVGYWGYFPFPIKIVIWFLWFIVSPLMITLYGYGVMKKIGWGENLPRNALLEWRSWCISKNYFMELLKKKIRSDRFYNFNVPITAVYISDDYIANDVTAPMMLEFFPNAPSRLMKLEVNKYTPQKVGHTGLFRKRFKAILWPWLLRVIQG